MAETAQNTFTPVQTAAVSAGGGLLSSIVNNWQANVRERKQREWNEAMMEKQNEWNIQQWNRENEYNSPLAQKQRLINAGLNPLNYGMDSSNAEMLTSANINGYQQASTPALENPIGAGVNAYMSAKMQEKQLELAEAQVAKTKSQTKQTDLDNQFAEDTMEAREEGVRLANEATKATIDKVKAERDKCLEEIKKTIEETKNEVEKRQLIVAQTLVQKATEKQILELLPLQKQLVMAQTEAQKAQAAVAFANAAYQNKLIEGGYIDELIRKARAEANTAEGRECVTNFEASLKNGTFFKIYEGDWWLTRAGKNVLNGLIQDIAVIGELSLGNIKL